MIYKSHVLDITVNNTEEAARARDLPSMSYTSEMQGFICYCGIAEHCSNTSHHSDHEVHGPQVHYGYDRDIE